MDVRHRCKRGKHLHKMIVEAQTNSTEIIEKLSESLLKELFIKEIRTGFKAFQYSVLIYLLISFKYIIWVKFGNASNASPTTP